MQFGREGKNLSQISIHTVICAFYHDSNFEERTQILGPVLALLQYTLNIFILCFSLKVSQHLSYNFENYQDFFFLMYDCTTVGCTATVGCIVSPKRYVQVLSPGTL